MLVEDSDLNYDSNYCIILGTKIGAVISPVHATMIRSGNEIEHLIEEEIDHSKFEGKIDFRVKYLKLKDGKRSIILDFQHEDNYEIDIGEWKLGSTFDTEKAPAVVQKLNKVQKKLQQTTKKKVNKHVMCYTANTHEEIKAGFKGVLPRDFNILTGRELAERYDFKYESPLDNLAKNQIENQEFLLNYFIKHMDQRVVRKVIENAI